MYTNLVVVLKIENKVEEILQEVGVCQGNNIAPVLFLFLISAFSETLEIEWRNAGIGVATIHMISNEDLVAGKGQVRGHTPKQYFARALTVTEILQCIYVNDSAFLFPTQEDMEKGMALIYHHFSRFGLKMHIGHDRDKSKTGCVFFPPLVFFPSKENVMELQEDEATSKALDYGNENDAIEMLPQNKVAETEEARTSQEDLLYNNLPETLPIAVDNGQITFCCHFKYLGLWISYNPCNDFDVNKQLTSATQLMGALKTVWNCPHLDIFNKYLLFRAIPMNLLLWGCKTWLIHQALLNKLEIFLHQSIRQILHVSMTCVKEERIRNEHMQRMSYDIPCVRNMIAARQLDFIGKAIRGAPNRPARS
jgi:hypothetical protein